MTCKAWKRGGWGGGLWGWCALVSAALPSLYGTVPHDLRESTTRTFLKITGGNGSMTKAADLHSCEKRRGWGGGWGQASGDLVHPRVTNINLRDRRCNLVLNRRRIGRMLNLELTTACHWRTRPHIFLFFFFFNVVFILCISASCQHKNSFKRGKFLRNK